MSLRFAILKTVTKGAETVALEYREDQLCERLKRRVRENLLKKSKLVHYWPAGEIDEAIEASFNELVTEFKEETVKIT